MQLRRLISLKKTKKKQIRNGKYMIMFLICSPMINISV